MMRGPGLGVTRDTGAKGHFLLSRQPWINQHCEIKLWAAQDISFVFVFPASGPRGQVLPAPGQAIWCCNSFDKTHLKCNKFYVSNKIFLYCQAYGLVLSSIRNFLKAWVGRCSNKRVLFYALCTFVDIIVNSSNLCESWEDRRNVSLSGYYGVIEPEMLRCCRWCNALRPFGLLSLALSF